MSKAFVFLVNGFEEVEAITPIDILRRGNVEVAVISLMDGLTVTGGRGLKVTADLGWAQKPSEDPDMIILPGGPGTKNYLAHKDFLAFAEDFCKRGGLTAAICAAPTVLAHIGLLDGKKAVCFPGCEEDMRGAEIINEHVVEDGNIVTGRAAGAAAVFGFKLLALLEGQEVSDDVRKSMVY